jgi:fumarylacetoacetase
VTSSWIEVAADGDFPIENLPFGIFSCGGATPRPGIAIGTQILDLRRLAETGMLDGACDRALLQGTTLNALFEADRWRPVRDRVADLLRSGGDPALREARPQSLLFAQQDATMHVPVAVGDYVDFYSSLEHATNLGRLFRPDGDPLLPNWRWIPIGYHGRSSTIVVDGTPVVRPHGQRKPPAESQPTFGPSAMLDIELEIGFVTSRPNALGDPIGVRRAREHVAGFVLVNDWSARDLQAWEYQPLGPFLGKSFATTVSPWIVTLDALEPFRIPGPVQDPPPLPYLAGAGDAAYDIALEVSILTQKMRDEGLPPHVISATNYGGMYWNFAQQLAHATANGAIARAGDLFASGTISGSQPGSEGSLIELTWRGQRPIELPNGEARAFLADGDEIALTGWCERPSARRIGFGQARGRIAAARSL